MTALYLSCLDRAVLGHESDVVNLATAADRGPRLHDSAIALPLDHILGLGKCRTTALGGRQIAMVFAVGDSDSLDLSKQVPEVKFACQRLGSGPDDKSEQQNFQQRFHHGVPNSDC